jgi:chromosome segregation ATPase
MIETREDSAEVSAKIHALEERQAELLKRRGNLSSQLESAREELGAAIAKGNTSQEEKLHAQLRDAGSALEGVAAALPILEADLKLLRDALKAARTLEAAQAVTAATARLDGALTACHESLTAWWETSGRAAYDEIGAAANAVRDEEGVHARLEGTNRVFMSEAESNQRPHRAVRGLHFYLDAYFAGRPFAVPQANRQAPREEAAEKQPEWHKLAL